MPNLLDIPAELRARIIASTLQFCQPAPADPTDVTDRNDLADIDVFLVNNISYYFASTMAFSPGAPILTSKDLVSW